MRTEQLAEFMLLTEGHVGACVRGVAKWNTGSASADIDIEREREREREIGVKVELTLQALSCIILLEVPWKMKCSRHNDKNFPLVTS